MRRHCEFGHQMCFQQTGDFLIAHSHAQMGRAIVAHNTFLCCSMAEQTSRYAS